MYPHTYSVLVALWGLNWYAMRFRYFLHSFSGSFHRGRYTVKVYPTFLFLHGKSYDFTVPFQSIVRLFLLPHNDMRQMYFVVSQGVSCLKG